MVYMTGLGQALNQVPTQVWGIVHMVTAVAGLWFAFKAKESRMLMWAFVLYALTGVMYTLVHFDLLDSYAVHILESVFVFVAVILVGISVTRK